MAAGREARHAPAWSATASRDSGCPTMDPLSAGLVTMELSRGDGSIGTFVGVQAGLAMRSIASCGSEEQKQRWLPPMARLERIGAFALTEPDHGSDSVSLETTARRDGDCWVLDGHKKWIGNGTIADVVVVWARDTADGRVKGFLVEKGTPGYQARRIERKASLRAVWQAEIALEGVRVAEHDRLPGANSFADTARVLAATRISCAWMALGHAIAGFDTALTYARRRRQFGHTLAHFQIVQQRLVRMLADVTAMQLYCLQTARLAERGALTDTLAGLAEAAQHRQGPHRPGRSARPAGRQRDPARLPRDAPHGRHRGRPHLRRHRDHADPHRGPRHHRHQRLHPLVGHLAEMPSPWLTANPGPSLRHTEREPEWNDNVVLVGFTEQSKAYQALSQAAAGGRHGTGRGPLGRAAGARTRRRRAGARRR